MFNRRAWAVRGLRTLAGGLSSAIGRLQARLTIGPGTVAGQQPMASDSVYTRLMPPEPLLLDNGTNVDNFRVGGEEFFEYFVKFCALQPHEHVLDVGSGIGRMAVPLTGYLTSEGSYDGFDIGPPAVEWCAKTITPQFPNFRFQLANIRNTHYNPNGRERAEGYRFTYADNSFDFTFATSVFTHLLPASADRYMSEIQRTLKSGGRCLMTYFFINDEAASLIRRRRSTLHFVQEGAEYHVLNRSVPEMAVAYDESFIRGLYAKVGLTVEDTIYGQWCGRDSQGSYQDIVKARKP